jgi:TrmH family RNA methyltransferase
MESNQIKYIKNLQQKKFRIQNCEFVVEGVKMVNELLKSDFVTKVVYYTEDYELLKTQVKKVRVSDKELKRISGLKTPNKVLAIAEIPEYKKVPNDLNQKLSLILEDIQDPGNMGTIIRIANWYGIENIFCTNDTVDCYNPKVVQSTMGAIFRSKIYYLDIYELINDYYKKSDFRIYATHLKGENIHTKELIQNGFIIMGNESRGISNKLDKSYIEKIKLPSYPPNENIMESLNVAVATAVTLAEFRRRQ